MILNALQFFFSQCLTFFFSECLTILFSECLLNLSFETETGVCQKQISFLFLFFKKKALVHQGKGAVRAAGRVGSFRGMADAGG